MCAVFGMAELGEEAGKEVNSELDTTLVIGGFRGKIGQRVPDASHQPHSPHN